MAFFMSVEMLHLVIGCMRSGKTTELDRLLTREKISGTKTAFFIAETGKREKGTHSRHRLEEPVSVKKLAEISDLKGCDAIFIDEVQFIEDAVESIKAFIADGKRVYASGLHANWKREQWPVISALIAISSRVTFLTAICQDCGSEANNTAKIESHSASIIDPGVSQYRSLCNRCYIRYHALSEDETSILAKLRGEKIR